MVLEFSFSDWKKKQNCLRSSTSVQQQFIVWRAVFPLFRVEDEIKISHSQQNQTWLVFPSTDPDSSFPAIV